MQYSLQKSFDDNIEVLKSHIKFWDSVMRVNMCVYARIWMYFLLSLLFFSATRVDVALIILPFFGLAKLLYIVNLDYFIV